MASDQDLANRTEALSETPHPQSSKDNGPPQGIVATAMEKIGAAVGVNKASQGADASHGVPAPYCASYA